MLGTPHMCMEGWVVYMCMEWWVVYMCMEWWVVYMCMEEVGCVHVYGEGWSNFSKMCVKAYFDKFEELSLSMAG